MKLTMVGTGYVGLVTGACFANSGNDVVCLDVDERVIDRLNRGECPIFEPGLTEMLVRNTQAGRLHYTTDKSHAYCEADAIFICVGTPSDDSGAADLKYVKQAADDIADAIDRAGPERGPKLVVVKSTVPVGTTHMVRDRIRERTKVPFYVANNPEFLKEGAAINDFLRPDRVVCGVDDEAAGHVLNELYGPFVRQGNPIFLLDVLSSEMVKYASNAMLACKISFINEMANLCEHYGADVGEVRQAMCADHRIGKQFFYPGLGYGGSCFPKDTLAVISMGKAVGYPCQLNQAVHDVNQDQRLRFWQKIENHFDGDLKGGKLAFWGVAFKPETDDIREAPSVTLMQKATKAGAHVRAYDPAAMERLAEESQDNPALAAVEHCADMYEALEGCDALIVCTEWSEFRNPDFDRIAAQLNHKVVFDGRNIYGRAQMRDLGFVYYCVGGTPVRPD